MADFLKRSATGLAAWWARPAAPHAIPVGIQVLIWTLLVGANALRLALNWLMGNLEGWSWPLMLADLVLTVLTYGGLFYLTWLVVVPRYFNRQKPLQVLLIVLLLVAGTSLLRLFTNISLGLMPTVVTAQTHVAANVPITGSFMDGLRAGYRASKEEQENGVKTEGATTGKNIVPATLLVMLLGIYLRLANDHQHEQRRRQEAEQQRRELEKQHLAAELSLLKAQINPHFLFNTLNNIYSLASEAEPDAPAANAVLQLSDLMRYLLYESSADTVPLSKEVDHLRSFLSLHLLRLPGAGPECLHFRVADEVAQRRGLTIAPMLLLPLVENAFKHGDLTARPHAVELDLALTEAGRLQFSVRNRRRAPRPGPAQPGGVGLANLRRRLMLLYPQRHELHVHDSADYYQVNLILAPTA